MDQIRIRGARTHNLKNINLDLPRNRLVVITGPVGLGQVARSPSTRCTPKASAATSRSLSAYARQFLQLMEKPDVDLIEGLSPAISIEQKATSHNPRSTVGTVTEIHDYLRLLFARVGDAVLPRPPSMTLAGADRLADGRRGARAAGGHAADDPGAGGRDRKGEQAELFEELRRRASCACASTARCYEIDAAAEADEEREAHDRRRRSTACKVRAGRASSASPNRSRPRCAMADGRAIAVEMDTRQASTCSRRSSPARSATTRCRSSSRACSRSTTRWAPARAATASGTIEFFDPKRVVAFPQLSLARGAIKGWDRRNQFYFQMLQSLAKHYGFDLDTPFEELPERVQQVVLHGSGEREDPVHATSSERGQHGDARARVRRHHPEPRAALSRDRFGRWCARSSPSICNTQALPRMRRHAPAPRGAPRQGRRRATQRAIYEICAHAAASRRCDFFEQLKLDGHKAGDRRQDRARDRASRLQFLNNVGLDYLSLDRTRRDAVGRRGAAHPARIADRLGPDRRDVRARRAVDRPAPARQRPPARHAASTCATSATA